MSSKILERLNKIIFENIPGNKNLSKATTNQDNRTISIIVIRMSFN